MNNKVVRFLEEPAVLSFRNQFLVILCLIAVLALTWAFRVESKEVLGTSNQAHWGDRQYAHLWVSREGVVTGARIEGGRLIFERGPLPGGFQETSIAVARPEAKNGDFVWAADLEANYVAWADGQKVAIARLDFDRAAAEAYASIPLKHVRGLNILNSEVVQAILSDGSVRVWNVGRRELVEETRIQFSGLEQVAGFGEYLGGASAKRLTLFRTVDGVPRMIDQADAPAAEFRLVIPGAGQIAALWSGGIVARGLKINTPGPVRAAALAPDNALTVAGDFQNILHCTPQECRAIAPVDGVSVLVSNDRFLAYSGAQGTGVRPFVLQRIFSPQGEMALWIGGGALALVCLLLLTGLALRMMAMAIEEKRNRLGNLPQQFPLPGGLLQAFAQGRVVLWAGSGLSAQVGLPTRTEFIRRLIDTAETEHWIDQSGGEMLMANVEKGRGEECVAAIAKRLGGSHHMDLQSCFRMMYRRICLMTPMFESLNKLPFSAAITTNYDTTLERMGPRWQNAVIPIPYNPLVAMKDQQFFLWKIYGDMQGQAPLILSRLELADTLARISVMPDVVDRLSRTKTFFFIGASLEGLIADLRVLGFKAQRGEKHYAFAAACGNGWKKQAECLRDEFGVEVAVVAENVVERALPELLQNLVDTLAQVRARRSSKSAASKIRAAG